MTACYVEATTETLGDLGGLTVCGVKAERNQHQSEQERPPGEHCRGVFPKNCIVLASGSHNLSRSNNHERSIVMQGYLAIDTMRGTHSSHSPRVALLYYLPSLRERITVDLNS